MIAGENPDQYFFFSIVFNDKGLEGQKDSIKVNCYNKSLSDYESVRHHGQDGEAVRTHHCALALVTHHGQDREG